MMLKVFVLDSEKHPLDPVHPGRARKLLCEGKAAVWRRYPFTIILKEAKPDIQVTQFRLKIDPGSKITGLAIVNDTNGDVIWAAELTHRGEDVRKNVYARRIVRRSRRMRKTRYRPARFANRRRPKGWLPPSLRSRINDTLTWVRRLCYVCPIGALSQELVRFDTQLLQNAEIEGIQYQQGELAGYEVREYLLEKWGRVCAYCGKGNLPLEIEHIIPKARGGTNRISNLTLACHACNEQKGCKRADEFGYPAIQQRANQPLKDAAAINSTRWTLYEQLQITGLPIELGTGGRTKWNRSLRRLPKTHWIDAACVGVSTPPVLKVEGVTPLVIEAVGWQRRQMCLMDKYGFPRTKAKVQSRVQGFRTGDLVRAVVPMGKKAGIYTGRVAVRAIGSFNITTPSGTVQGIAARYCQVLHQRDGYFYQKGATRLPSLQ